MSEDAMCMASMMAAVDKDLIATPISRARMDLLWLDPAQMEGLRQAQRQGLQAEFPVHSEFQDNGPLFVRLQDAFDRGEIGVVDLDWALQVDALALEAHTLTSDRPLDAIGKYREALALAPSCDLYLMSMGALYAELGAPQIGLRYLQRSAQLNPTNARIARNLAAMRSYL